MNLEYISEPVFESELNIIKKLPVLFSVHPKRKINQLKCTPEKWRIHPKITRQLSGDHQHSLQVQGVGKWPRQFRDQDIIVHWMYTHVLPEMFTGIRMQARVILSSGLSYVDGLRAVENVDFPAGIHVETDSFFLGGFQWRFHCSEWLQSCSDRCRAGTEVAGRRHGRAQRVLWEKVVHYLSADEPRQVDWSSRELDLFPVNADSENSSNEWAEMQIK